MTNYNNEREEAKKIAIEAAHLVKEWYQKGVEVEWKGKDDPVTSADREANELIVDRLSQRFPGDAILSEEIKDDRSRLDADRLWIVDPLDGTKDFINATGDFAVMIGLVEKGIPVVGAVCCPIGMKLWHASKGSGSLKETAQSTHKLCVSNISKTSDMRMVVTRTHRFALLDQVAELLEIKKERPLGSVGLKVASLVDTEADLYVHLSLGIKEWDTCAPEVILNEAGGIITDTFGEQLMYNCKDVMRRRGVIASNNQIHGKIVDILKPLAEKTFN